MNWPDMTNYDLDALSLCWGAVASFVWFVFIKGIVQAIRLIINFIKWLIVRKRLDKSSKELVEAFEEVINRQDG